MGGSDEAQRGAGGRAQRGGTLQNTNICQHSLFWGPSAARGDARKIQTPSTNAHNTKAPVVDSLPPIRPKGVMGGRKCVVHPRKPCSFPNQSNTFTTADAFSGGRAPARGGRRIIKASANKPLLHSPAKLHPIASAMVEDQERSARATRSICPIDTSSCSRSRFSAVSVGQ